MGTPRGKSKGYAQHILGIDTETTGLCFGTQNPVLNPKTKEHHQILSIGLIIVDTQTMESVEELYLEIKWNELSLQQKLKNPDFGKSAVKVHGLTFKHLEEHGVDEEEAVMEIGNLILKYWGPTVTIKCLGHNVHLFDIPFLRDLFDRHGIELKFGARHYDSNSLALGTFGVWNSDDLFKAVGFDTRKEHNALDDANMSVESFRRVRMIFNKGLETL